MRVPRHLHPPNLLPPNQPTSICLPVHGRRHDPLSGGTLVAQYIPYTSHHSHRRLAPGSWHAWHYEPMCLIHICIDCIVNMPPSAAGCARGAGPAPQHHLQGRHRPGHGDGQGVGGGHPGGGGTRKPLGNRGEGPTAKRRRNRNGDSWLVGSGARRAGTGTYVSTVRAAPGQAAGWALCTCAQGVA